MPQPYLRCQRTVSRTWRSLLSSVAIGALPCPPAVGSAMGAAGAHAYAAHDEDIVDHITGTAVARPCGADDGEAGSHVGYSVSGAGDVNRAGYSDIIVGTAGHNSGAGIVYLVHAFTSTLTVTTIGIGP